MLRKKIETIGQADGEKKGQNQFLQIDKIITKITCPETVEKTEYETKTNWKTRKECFSSTTKYSFKMCFLSNIKF